MTRRPLTPAQREKQRSYEKKYRASLAVNGPRIVAADALQICASTQHLGMLIHEALSYVANVDEKDPDRKAEGLACEALAHSVGEVNWIEARAEAEAKLRTGWKP